MVICDRRLPRGGDGLGTATTGGGGYPRRASERFLATDGLAIGILGLTLQLCSWSSIRCG